MRMKRAASSTCWTTPTGRTVVAGGSVSVASAGAEGSVQPRLSPGFGKTDSRSQADGEKNAEAPCVRLHGGRLGDTAGNCKAARHAVRESMNVFVYGTLLVPKIWETVTATTDLVSHPAELDGYLIRRVRDAVYPGIVVAPESGVRVPGGFSSMSPGRPCAVSTPMRTTSISGKRFARSWTGWGWFRPRLTWSHPRRRRRSCPPIPGR